MSLELVWYCRFETLGWEFPSWSDTPGPAFNILKGGILAADRVMTVSQVCLQCPHSKPKALCEAGTSGGQTVCNLYQPEANALILHFCKMG